MRYAINELSSYQKDFSDILLSGIQSNSVLCADTKNEDFNLKTLQESLKEFEDSIVEKVSERFDTLMITPFSHQEKFQNTLLDKLTKCMASMSPVRTSLASEGE